MPNATSVGCEHLSPMEISEILLLLIAAHCYGDFLVQPNGMAVNKHKTGIVALHGLLHGALVYLVLQQWGQWQIPLAVLVFHTLIDRVKSVYKTTPETFALDQLAHLISLILISFAAVSWNWIDLSFPGIVGRDLILIGAGFCAAVFGPGFFIIHVAERLVVQNPELDDLLGNGLKRGGVQIGRLERALIFLFLAIGHPAGIGFLIAAKSILRFEEAKEQKVAEYVLIGTFWSFGSALGIGWLTFQVIS